ncbi:archaemetzincin family Zn-dependent metalloprotease [Candidatus Bathyarchaeota archaeon]|nr:archaemetzincin family Zn-dependent metalloprotease [Candidatus Bathyarchaeota archaeon]
MRVLILPIGPVDSRVLEALKLRLPEFLPLKEVAISGDVLKVPEDAYDPIRRQYRSSKILSMISAYRPPVDDERVLGVTGVDLYAPGLNFVFGEAKSWRGPAVISTYRLSPEYYGMPRDDEIFLGRALKEAVHELGHALGLGHCKNPRCVMFFSNSILDTDRKGVQLCGLCHTRVLENLKGGIF